MAAPECAPDPPNFPGRPSRKTTSLGWDQFSATLGDEACAAIRKASSLVHACLIPSHPGGPNQGLKINAHREPNFVPDLAGYCQACREASLVNRKTTLRQISGGPRDKPRGL